MISREEALVLIQKTAQIMDAETVPLNAALGRILHSPVIAQVTQPPADMSAMDGYAVRFVDCELDSLNVIGEAPAGTPFEGRVEPGEAVRIFTGSVVPDGADHVVIQEDVERDGDTIRIVDPQPNPRNIRAAGLDFSKDDILIPVGSKIGARQLSLIAATNVPEVDVRRKPRVALLANGDELKLPGSDLKPGQIVASNGFSLTALIEAWGGEVVDLGILPDNRDEITRRILATDRVDVFVPVGGASVGDHDHMKPVFEALGYSPVFSKVAIKPGKPTWLYENGDKRVLGLPGNPASAIVCAHLFLRPLLRVVQGADPAQDWINAELDGEIPANGGRESFLRAKIYFTEGGQAKVSSAPNQDSSLLRPFLDANALIHRLPNESSGRAGDLVRCVRLD